MIINFLYYYARDDNDISWGVHVKILLLCFRCPRTVQITMNLILSFWATLLVNLTLFKPIFMWTVSVTESKDWTFGLIQPRNSTPTPSSGTSATYCKDHTSFHTIFVTINYVCGVSYLFCSSEYDVCLSWILVVMNFLQVDYCYFNFKWVWEALHKAKNCRTLLSVLCERLIAGDNVIILTWSLAKL